MPVNMTALFGHIAAVIGEMEDVFGSHEFIRRLVWRQQGLFVEALYAYRSDAPFRKVHARISNELRNYPPSHQFHRAPQLTECLR